MFPPLTAWCSDVFACWSTMRRSAPCCIILCMMLMLPFLLQGKKSLTHILHQLFDNCGLKIMQISALTNKCNAFVYCFEGTPYRQAKWKGVCPASQGILGSAPLFRRSSVIGLFPWRAAKWRAVNPPQPEKNTHSYFLSIMCDTQLRILSWSEPQWSRRQM